MGSCRARRDSGVPRLIPLPRPGQHYECAHRLASPFPAMHPAKTALLPSHAAGGYPLDMRGREMRPKTARTPVMEKRAFGPRPIVVPGLMGDPLGHSLGHWRSCDDGTWRCPSGDGHREDSLTAGASRKQMPHGEANCHGDRLRMLLLYRAMVESLLDESVGSSVDLSNSLLLKAH